MAENPVFYRAVEVSPDWPAPIQGAVLRGELHVPGCDAEECLRCHGQALACDRTEPVDPPRGEDPAS